MSERSNEERLSNILDALDEHLEQSPFTKEEWAVLDADRIAFLLRAEVAEADNERLRGLLRRWRYAPVQIQAGSPEHRQLLVDTDDELRATADQPDPLAKFAHDLAASQRPMDPDAAKVLHENRFDLYEPAVQPSAVFTDRERPAELNADKP